MDAFRENRAAVFVGAGASIAAGLPSWDDIVTTLAEELDAGGLPSLKKPLSSETLLKIPEYYLNAHNGTRRNLARILDAAFKKGRTAFRALKPKLDRPIHHYLAKLPTNLFYTTNFDTLLEDELRDQHVDVEVIEGESGAMQATERGVCQVRKIHGSLRKVADWDDLVLTRNDFASISKIRPVLFETLAGDLRSEVFLFVGYSLRDPDFNAVYHNVFQRMARKQQTHFIALVKDPGKHERVDLALQGLVTIPLWEYPGRDATEKTCAFLRAVLRDTAEITHLRSYYRDLQVGDSIPLVIASRPHDIKGYAYYPSSDIHTAYLVATHLQRMGVVARFIPDRHAVRDAASIRRNNVIIVCSPAGNEFAEYVFGRAAHVNCKIRERFEINKSDGRRRIVTKRKIFRADDLLGGRGKRVEYMLVARYANPWAAGKFIYVYAGCHALGTYAAGDFLSAGGYRTLSEREADDIVAIVPIHYSRYDPLEPRFSFGQPVFL